MTATAMSRAVRNREWERLSLYLLIAVARTARAMPPGTVDDVLALLDSPEASDAPRPR